MPKTFSVADEEAIEITLRNGQVVHARDLTTDIVDAVGKVEEKGAKEAAKDEVEQRADIRIVRNDESSDEDVSAANNRLIERATKSGQRARKLAYEQLAKVFVDAEGNPVPEKLLTEQIPVGLARRVAGELTEQILGIGGGVDASGNGSGSGSAATPTGTTA